MTLLQTSTGVLPGADWEGRPERRVSRADWERRVLRAAWSGVFQAPTGKGVLPGAAPNPRVSPTRLPTPNLLEKDKLPLPQPCSPRVLADVLQAIQIVFRIPDQAVPIVFLPEFARGSGLFSDLIARKSLPATQDISEAVIAKRPKQHMDMVGHYDERRQFVSLAIEILQCISHDPGQCRILQDAGSAPLIQPVLDPSKKPIVVASCGLRIPRSRVVFQPEYALFPPLNQFCLGKRVSQAPSHEYDLVTLLPVGQPISANFNGCVRIEVRVVAWEERVWSKVLLGIVRHTFPNDRRVQMCEGDEIGRGRRVKHAGPGRRLKDAGPSRRVKHAAPQRL